MSVKIFIDQKIQAVMADNNHFTQCLGHYDNPEDADLRVTVWRDEYPDLKLIDYTYTPDTRELVITYTNLNPQIEI